ncbi:MAG TPA: cellulase family glycosylhydrolase, partial [Polyangiaceae bacterium]|nr:cellulase family glycosylhydrolase [Polyangiaceae bacterium]
LGFQFSVVKNFPFDFWLDDISLIIDDPTVAAPDPPPATPGGYHVVGNQVLTGDGTPYLFHGMHRPSLEWAEVGDNQSKEDFELMKSWGANVVRMGLNQAFWLRSPGYKDTVDQNVRWAQASGLDVILDLHWSDRGEDGVAAQQRVADKNSLIFWQELADIYKDNQRILFELYNEPHHVTWDVWRDGGDSGDGFEAVGMQDMYDVVRATGAQNLVLIGGIDYAYDLSGVATHAVTGDNIIYASHPYDTKERLPDNWPTAWAYLAPTYPLMLSEFGLIDVWGLAPGTCNDSAYVQQAIDYANQLKVSWAGYAWYPEPDLSRPCSFPSLINDWTGTPSPIGVIVKTELGKLK